MREEDGFAQQRPRTRRHDFRRPPRPHEWCSATTLPPVPHPTTTSTAQHSASARQEGQWGQNQRPVVNNRGASCPATPRAVRASLVSHHPAPPLPPLHTSTTPRVSLARSGRQAGGGEETTHHHHRRRAAAGVPRSPPRQRRRSPIRPTGRLGPS